MFNNMKNMKKEDRLLELKDFMKSYNEIIEELQISEKNFKFTK